MFSDELPSFGDLIPSTLENVAHVERYPQHMSQTFDDASRERLVNLMHAQPVINPQSDPPTFNFETARYAFEAVQREAIKLANDFNPGAVHTILSDL